MSKSKFSEELKNALLAQSQKEKDRLLVRLVRKDRVLTDQLQFRLLENTQSDLDYRVAEIKESIDQFLTDTNITRCRDVEYYFRKAVVGINYHFRITKDHKGELDLLIYAFNLVMKYSNLCDDNPEDLKNWRTKRSREKLKKYCLNKFSKVKQLLARLHEDYHIEFEEDINRIEEFIETL